MAQEQLLEGGRLADQAAHTGVAQDPDQLAEALAVDLGVQRVPSMLTSSTPGMRLRSPGSPSNSALIDVRLRCRIDSSVPLSTVLPARMIVTRSHSASTSDRMWLDSKHGDAAIARLGDALAKHLLHQRVQATAGLVEEQQPGPRRERGDQRRPSAGCPSSRSRACLVRVEVEALDQLGAALLVDAAAHPGEQVDGFAAGQRSATV